ncbi:phage DNA methylase [Mycobacteroides abscessus subsp. massiliense]|uniref:DNA cytosine methyltransferase n=1 Tax=Mycobacteroides abscessus TaxID=36809 RepID=UPI00092B21FD|nr:DNA cytosine methyltransferase [Mycobacteroides abscessus]MBN7559820.1 DNA cytosine methyltransferase [Mycobacteroides abscessus subsp. abscessus]MDB2219065.1 DNA cytosine methyltransferase [Mycobacteroides abscessus subsp. abscessus]QSN24871.1 DNA cytosine methyltransferase [Mycobacteroides abscessus subsp. abscessus]QSN30073.1 DNA cytosine methyltransferase [Mycobacteroides abscessus subsp. abscessus]SII62928.1 phage DNA methylase [Mycobacteroides abscessus subsp. abscessus]
MLAPRIGSLFSGAGGLDLAVEHVAGGRTVWHCEADPDASRVLAAHWPGVPNLGDITAVDWSAVEPVDVLCGGFPCQDVSAAGRRAGIASGTRSGLWLEYAEAINQLRPRLVVIENVRGLLSGYAHRAMEPGPDDLGDRSSRPLLRAAGAVLGDLADLGYDAQWTTVAASEVGAPHRRERVFIVAHPAGSGRPNQQKRGNAPRFDVIAEPGAGDRDSARGATAGIHQLERSARELAAVDLLPTPTASRYGSNQSPSPGVAVRPGLDSIADLLPTPNASDATGGGQTPDKREGHSRQLIDYALLNGTPQWGKYEPAIRRWEAITREAPTPTEPGARGNPRLAAAFSEWMMGWPIGWVTRVGISHPERPGMLKNGVARDHATAALSRSAMLRIIGNGVVPQQAVAALQWLLSVCEVAA